MPSNARRSCPPVVAPLNLLALDPEEVERTVRDLGWPRYRSEQILRWLYRRRVREIRLMTTLSRRERDQLSAIAYIGRFPQSDSLVSADGTRKLVATLDDDLRVESVVIPDGRRLTLCVSTQVGCTLDCRFCLTGQMGLKRNLRAHEIVDQVLTAQDQLERDERLSNLVLMGMGEPLANLAEVSAALTRLGNQTWGVGFARRRITLSTAGLASRLEEAAALGVNLAVSLNAATEAIRSHLMPAVNTLHSLQELLAVCRKLPLAPRQRLTFEYVLLAGVNDSHQEARRLAKLVAGLRCRINLIPFNDFPGSPYRCPADNTILAFQSTLKEAGLDVFLRKSKGRDVLGACGQLGTPPRVPQHDRPPLVGALS